MMRGWNLKVCPALCEYFPLQGSCLTSDGYAQAMRKWKEAEDLFLQAVGIYKHSLGAKHSITVTAMLQLLDTQVSSGEEQSLSR